ncbi:MAG: Hsp20/alpha crystallin family protein [Minisyncoccia bacterium]
MSNKEENIFAELAKNKNEKPSIQFDDLNENAEGKLLTDVYQTPNEIVIETAIAGVNPEEDLDINITSDSVTIKGERKKQNKVEDKDYLYQECFWGKFARTIMLPQEIDPEKSEAEFKNGVLIIKLPKLDQKKAKKLKIKTN